MNIFPKILVCTDTDEIQPNWMSNNIFQWSIQNRDQNCEKVKLVQLLKWMEYFAQILCTHLYWQYSVEKVIKCNFLMVKTLPRIKNHPRDHLAKLVTILKLYGIFWLKFAHISIMISSSTILADNKIKFGTGSEERIFVFS